MIYLLWLPVLGAMITSNAHLISSLLGGPKIQIPFFFSS